MDKRLASCILAGALLSVPLSTSAHHGTGISYDLATLPVTAKGTVTEFKWGNPHVSIFIDIKNEQGQVESWAIEGNSPYNYARMGFNRTTLKAGQEVTIVFYKSKVKDVKAGVIAKIVMPDGMEVLRFQRDAPTRGEGVR